MSIDYIRRRYQVPAKRGGRVIYTGEKTEKQGVIASARGGYLRIRMDGEKHARPYHPTWELAYV